MRNKILAVCLVCIALCICGLSGCGRGSIPDSGDNHIQIVCTTFPQYDWVSNLIRGNDENISLTLLMDKGGDLHNFQPSALDIAKVSNCDLFIYVGGESDAWVDDALAEAVNADMRVINMMEAINGQLVEEEHFEGISHTKHSHDEHDDETEYDEHIWLSLRNAQLIVGNIERELVDMDAENAALYESNCGRYISELTSLDRQYMEVVDKSHGDTLLFADRFPFRYLVEDYGLDYYAAFEGCSAETEASFKTVAFLADRLDELGLECVLVLEGSDDRLARVLIENTKTKHHKILVLDSMQSVSQKDIGEGISYLSIMNENLKTLKQALD